MREAHQKESGTKTFFQFQRTIVLCNSGLLSFVKDRESALSVRHQSFTTPRSVFLRLRLQNVMLPIATLLYFAH